MSRVAEIAKQYNLTLDRAKEGFSSEVYFSEDKVLKYNKEKDYSNEARILEILHNTEIPVPKILAIGKDFILLERIRGTIIKNPTQELHRNIGKIYRKLHSITREECDFQEFIDSLNRKFKLASTFQVPSKCSLLHCDPSPKNILVENEKITALIDFEWSRFGDPLFDIAAYESRNPVEFHQAFREGYGDYEFDEDIIHKYKVLRELQILHWARERRIQDVIKMKEESLKKLAPSLNILDEPNLL